jgi:hypothetical protein
MAASFAYGGVHDLARHGIGSGTLAGRARAVEARHPERVIRLRFAGQPDGHGGDLDDASSHTNFGRIPPYSMSRW